MNELITAHGILRRRTTTAAGARATHHRHTTTAAGAQRALILGFAKLANPNKGLGKLAKAKLAWAKLAKLNIVNLCKFA